MTFDLGPEDEVSVELDVSRDEKWFYLPARVTSDGVAKWLVFYPHSRPPLGGFPRQLPVVERGTRVPQAGKLV